MSDIEPVFSPDQRFFISLGSNEIRMSHWITTGSLFETRTNRAKLSLGSSLWSVDQVVWQPDSRYVTVELRRYPGDAPSIHLDIYPDTQIVIPHEPADTAPIRFRKLNRYLESYYTQHRGVTPPSRL